MRRAKGIVFALALVVAAGTATAQGPDYAQGWIGLFDGESLFGWTAFSDAQWTVADGTLACEAGSGGWLATTSQFMDFELTARVRVEPKGSAGLVVRAGLEGHPTENGSAMLVLAGTDDNAWQQVRVVAQGNEIRAEINGQAFDPVQTARAKGHVGILYHRSKVEVAEVYLRPLNLTPIFNGVDLTGWNIIPDRRSVFSVVDGALNIKDGNGQIETDAVYKDFVLQMAIYSNGDHLNSGVFFRGPKGVFWKGYESQVRNEWEGDDRAKPVDFGTGGNYGNQPARRVVSSDREWFYKTIVCAGNHAAVWINGYLVSDYLDMRPVDPGNDGKRGYVPGPGTIHLQGHDPKTDLSFRNIVIQEYPE